MAVVTALLGGFASRIGGAVLSLLPTLPADRGRRIVEREDAS